MAYSRLGTSKLRMLIHIMSGQVMNPLICAAYKTTSNMDD